MEPTLRLGRVANPLTDGELDADDDVAGLFKTSGQAYREDVVPTANRLTRGDGPLGAPTAKGFDLYGRLGGSAQESPKEGVPPKGGFDLYADVRSQVTRPQATDSDQPSSFMRGLKTGGWESAKETAVGATALAADTLGAKETADSAYAKYRSMRDEAEKKSQSYESFTNVLEGDASFGSFLGYWSGYALGQVAQTATAAVAGAAVGSVVPGTGTVAGAIAGVVERGALQAGVKGFVAKKLEERVAGYMAANAAKGMAKDEAEKLAYQSAAKSVFRELGAASAVTAQNIWMEGSSIYGEARSEAEKRGEETDLGRVWTGTILAAASETAMDLFAIKGLTNAFGGGNIVKNIAVESFKGGLREGATEAIQTGFERYGAKKELLSDEAKRDYVDSAAAGAVGGVLFGTTKGVKGSLTDDDQRVVKTIEDARGTFTKRDEGQQTTDETGQQVPPATDGETQTPETNSAGFVREPIEQVQAQIDAVREGRKPVVVTGQQEAAEVDSSGLQRFDIADPQTGEVAVVFGTDPQIGEAAQVRANEVGLRQAMGELLGFSEPDATTNPAPDTVVVQQVDDQSNEVIDEQAVSAANVGSVQSIPGTTPQITTVDGVITDRQDNVAQEQGTQQTADSGAQDSDPPPSPAVQAALDKARLAAGQRVWGQYAPEGVKWTSLTDEAKSRWADSVAAGAPNMELANAISGVQPATQPAAPKKTKKAKEPAVADSAVATEQEASERWEDDDDGKVAHIPWSELSKETKQQVRDAVGGGYYNSEKHDELVMLEVRNAAKAARNARIAEARKNNPEADGIDLRRSATEAPTRDFAYVTASTINQLERGAQRALDNEGKGRTIRLSAVPVSSIVNTMPGLGVIERAAKLFGKKVKYFKVVEGSGFFDGAVMPGTDTIFINVNATYPHLRIFGHELVHAIKNAHPETYQRLKTFLIPMLNEKGMADFALKQKEWLVNDQETILEEAIGDIMGDRFGEQEFWKLMANENPSLFRQIADIAIEFLDGLLKKLGVKQSVEVRNINGSPTLVLKNNDPKRTLGSDTLVNDIVRVRNGIASVLSGLGEMVQQEQTNRQQSVAKQSVAKKVTDVSKPAPSSPETRQADPMFRRAELKETGGFYSALEQAFKNPKISLDKNGATTGQQWKAWLNSKKAELGVKSDEIEWTGIDNWFDLNADQKLTSKQVLEWTAGNRVNVNDILLRSYGKTDQDRGPVADIVEPDEVTLREFVRDRIDEQAEEDREFGLSPDDMSVADLRGWIAENFGWNNFLYQHRRQAESFQRGRLAKMTRPKHNNGNLVLEGGTNYAEIVLFDPTIAPYAQGDETHYGDVARGQAIGWIRMNERKDDDGNDVLFLEELQSKRAQDLRKGEQAVPDAPFIKKTESWTALLIKRAVAYAQQRGIDRVVWTTGEQQNERYKFPGDELVYAKDADKDTFTLTIKKDGDLVRTVKNVPAQKLSDYVGEGTASAIESGKLSGVLRGDDLKLMDANLQPFYNQTVPSVAKKFLKEFGGTVEVMNIEGTGQQLGFVIPKALQAKVTEDGLPMFSRRDYEAGFDGLPQHVRDMAIAKGYYSPPTIKERLQSLRPNMWRRVIQGTFDKFHSVKSITMKGYTMLRMSTTIDGPLEGLLHYGQVFDDGGALNVRKGTKGLLEILKPLGNEVDRFLLWIAANRAAQLKKEDRENFFTQQEIDELTKINLGKMRDGKYRAGVYAETLTKMNELNRSVLELAKSKGLINEAGFKKFSNDIWYIPFYRVMEGEGTLAAAQTSSGAVNQFLSKKLKGSTRQINDLMENVLLNWSHIMSASMKNSAAVETLNAATAVGAATKLTKVDSKFGRDANGGVYPLKYAVKVMESGEETYYNIEDELLLASLDAATTLQTNGFWMNTGRAFKTTLTKFISLSPTFKINNLIRDSIQSIGISQLRANPVANVWQGWRAYKDDRAEALVGGGLFAMGNAYDGDRSANVKRLIKMGVADADILTTPEKAKAWLVKFGEKYDDISDRAENANRLALYQQLRANGATHLEAAYAARDLQDFSLQGSWTAIRWAAMMLPYFNARMQGLYKLGRGAVENPQKFAAVSSVVTAIGLLLYLSQKDDDDWKKREEWDKDAFFWFKIGDKAVRIPKPFEMGAMATIIERTVEQMVDKDVEGKVFGKRLLAVLADQLAINPIPQFIRPLSDIAQNKDGFTDRPIESMGQERLSPEFRVSPATSTAGLALGKINAMFANFASSVTGEAISADKFKLSPVQYDYLLRGYLGWVGTVIQTTSNLAADTVKTGESPDRKIDNMFVVGSYIKSLPQSQSRWVTSFYEQAKEIATATADYKSFLAAGNVDKAVELLEANKDKISLNKLYSNMSDKLSTITKQINRVRADETMSGAQKRLEMDRLTQLRIEMAKGVEEARIAMKR